MVGSALKQSSHAIFANIVDVMRVAIAGCRGGRGALRLAGWSGPWVDKPVLDSQWAPVALANLVRGGYRCAHVRPQSEQAGEDPEFQRWHMQAVEGNEQCSHDESETPARPKPFWLTCGVARR